MWCCGWGGGAIQFFFKAFGGDENQFKGLGLLM